MFDATKCIEPETIYSNFHQSTSQPSLEQIFFPPHFDTPTPHKIALENVF